MTKTTQSVFDVRMFEYEKELKDLYYELYADNSYYSADEKYHDLIKLMKHFSKDRKSKFEKADLDNPDWFHRNDIVGTTLYVDLFSDNLAGFINHIPYFKELGINFIHFMPILEGRPGENDGGYAVKNYKRIDPKFGTNEEFHEVVNALKKNGIHSCVDFVVNHTAKEHEFAVKAFEGDKVYQDMYFMYDTDETPKAFDRTVPEVFPNVSPGNFTYYPELEKWVFTSFYPFQWDLNYYNPLVFEKIVDILLNLANMGIDMIRLDAIPFMWKEVGTQCRNHPTIHKILRMFQLITDIVCPSVALLGEAIVQPEEIVKYYGEDNSECDIMYNATHMVNLWNSLATRDTRLLQIDTERLQTLSGGCWINYARCHDDIGWGFNEDATRSMGLDPFLHKQFLINFYKGEFPDSFSIGALYEFDPNTMDARNCGTLASLTGLQKATEMNDAYQRELALKRINLIHSVLIASAGIPLIYSGDEIATLNNYDYLDDRHKSHDSRWMHRGHFDHKRAEKRKDLGTNEGIVFQTLRSMISLRKADPIFGPTVYQHILDTGNHHIYCFYKRHHDHTLIALFNFSEDRQYMDTGSLHSHGIKGAFKDLLTGKSVNSDQGQLQLGPYEYLWLVSV